MKAKQKKAKELIEMFMPYANGYTHLESAKQCAIICVDEIIKCTHSDKRANSVFDKEFWQSVRNEIINYK